jgi:nucleotide-binding universal stress UspA family protein
MTPDGRGAMASFRRILLCYDGTREGRRALLQGAELAEDIGAETHLLAIASAVGGGLVEQPSAIAVQAEEDTVKEVLREGVERLKARGLRATGHLVFGSAVDCIPTAARDLAVDLIVVGYRPTGIAARWWAGPGKAQLLDLVSCSILVSIDAATGRRR